MTRRVLVIWWSQSGQLERVARTFAEPFSDAGHEVVFAQLRPMEPFPFPWKLTSFFGEFAESVLGRPRPIAPVVFPPGEWDLVVVAAQVWFLSPSQPFAAFLQGPDAAVLKGRRVLTLMSCRNMWVSGWRRLVGLVEAAGGHVTDRVVVTQGGAVFASYFQTLAFMLTGRRDAIKALPPAQVAEHSFVALAEHARVAARRLADAAPQAPLLSDRVTAGVSHAHAFGEAMMAPIFRLLATCIAAISRPRTAARAVSAVFMCAFIVGSVLALFLPCVLTERVLRRWIDPWLERRASLPIGRLSDASPSR